MLFALHKFLTSFLITFPLYLGTIWKPKEQPKISDEETKILLDLDDESSEALKNATEADLVDLAGILGLHSLLNQDQFHASITNKEQNAGTKFSSIVKATAPKRVPNLPDNDTNVEKTSEAVVKNESSLSQLNWNNIKHIPRDIFKKLFEGLRKNTTLKELDLANTGLTDGPCSVGSEDLFTIQDLLCSSNIFCYVSSSSSRS